MDDEENIVPPPPPQQKTPAQIETEKREYWKMYPDVGLNYSTTSAVVFVGMIFGTNMLNNSPHTAKVLAIGNVITFMCFYLALFFKVGGKMYAGLSVVGSCGQNAMIAFTVCHVLLPKDITVHKTIFHVEVPKEIIEEINKVITKEIVMGLASGAAAFLTLIVHALLNWDTIRENVTCANIGAWIMGMYEGWLPNPINIHGD